MKGYVSHDRETLEAVSRARAAATGLQVTQEVLKNPEVLKKFQQLHGNLSSVLSRLLVVTENFRQLKTDAGFRDLQSQFEGTENRITAARQRYITSVEQCNALARSLPTNLTAKLFSYLVKPSFNVANEAAIWNAPTVNFSK